MDTIVMPWQTLPSASWLNCKRIKCRIPTTQQDRSTIYYKRIKIHETMNDGKNSSEKDYPAYGDGSRKDGALGTGILSAEKLKVTVSRIRRNCSIDRLTVHGRCGGRQRRTWDEDPVVDEYYHQPSTVLLSGGAGTNTHQRKNDAEIIVNVEKGGESEVVKNDRKTNRTETRSLSGEAEVGKISQLRRNPVIKEIEAEGREATPEEKAVLEQFSGWGGIPAIFNSPSLPQRTRAELPTK